MLYEFEMGHNAVEETKRICCAKDEDVLYHNRETQIFYWFSLCCKNLEAQERPSRPKTVDCDAVLEAKE